MSAVPAILGPMRYQFVSSKHKAIKYLGYNWFLCSQHLQAIKKIDPKANRVFKDYAHIYNKNYHRVMAVCLFFPVLGHIVAFLEAFFHRIRVKQTVEHLNDKEYGIDCIIENNDAAMLLGFTKEEIKDYAEKLAKDVWEEYDIPEKLMESPYFAHQVVSISGLRLKDFPKHIRTNKEVAFAAINQDLEAFHVIDASLKIHKPFLLACLEKQGNKFFEHYLPVELKNDYAFCLQAASRHGTIFACLPENFRAEGQMVLEAFADYVPYTAESAPIKAKAKAFPFIQPKAFQKHPALLNKILERNGRVLKYLYPQNQTEERIRIALRKNYIAYKYIPEEKKKDEKFLLEAIEINSEVFRYATPEQKKDKNLVLKLMARNGRLLEHVDITLQIDREVVQAAVKMYGEVLQWAPAFKDDFAIASLALDSNSSAIQFFGESLLSNKKLILKAVSLWSGALAYAHPDLKKDREVVLRAIEHDGAALDDADPSLINDTPFLVEVLQKCCYPERAWSHIPDTLQADPEVKAAFQGRLQKKA